MSIPDKAGDVAAQPDDEETIEPNILWAKNTPLTLESGFIHAADFDELENVYDRVFSEYDAPDIDYAREHFKDGQTLLLLVTAAFSHNDDQAIQPTVHRNTDPETLRLSVLLERDDTNPTDPEAQHTVMLMVVPAGINNICVTVFGPHLNDEDYGDTLEPYPAIYSLLGPEEPDDEDIPAWDGSLATMPRPKWVN